MSVLDRRVSGPTIAATILFPIVFFILVCSCAIHPPPPTEKVWGVDELGWSVWPLTVQWDRSRWNPIQNFAIEHALYEFPCGMFVEFDKDIHIVPRVKVTVNDGLYRACGKFGPLNEVKYAGTAYRCNRWEAEVVLKSDGPATWMADDVYVLFVHEIGHVAGLVHDVRAVAGADSVSMMAPNVMSHADRRLEGLSMPTITNKDYNALSRRYCRDG